MTKKTQDLKPDVILKNYWSNKDQFADIFNAVLFEGRQVIRAEELEDIDTEESTVLEHREYAQSISATRDCIKISKRSLTYGVELVMLGLENQEHVHYAMPMRLWGYDYGTYKKQYDSNAQKYKTSAGLSEDEYLSKMKKTDKFIPVITIVVYYGDNPWDGATTLHEMLNIPEPMRPFVNDYKMLLVEARENNLLFHNMNNIAFFDMMRVILDRTMEKKEAKEKVIDYAAEHKVDKSVIMTVAGATNCKINYNAITAKGEVTVCTLFDEIAKEGELKGELKGEIRGRAKGIIETGLDFELSENDILERLQLKLNIPLQKAQEYFELYGKRTV